MDIQTYSIDFIKNLATSITDGISNEIKENLLEIKLKSLKKVNKEFKLLVLVVVRKSSIVKL